MIRLPALALALSVAASAMSLPAAGVVEGAGSQNVRSTSPFAATRADAVSSRAAGSAPAEAEGITHRTGVRGGPTRGSRRASTAVNGAASGGADPLATARAAAEDGRRSADEPEASRARESVDAASRARWAWPVRAANGALPRVARRFDAPRERWTAGHRGADLAAEVGAAVVAPDDGVVAFAGVVAGRGTVSIDHPGGVRSTFEPVTALVRAGERVSRGQVVAGLGAEAGHCAPAACLHLGARRGRVYVDPLTFLHRSSPVLLPP